MAFALINVGATANDGTGDSFRAAFEKSNGNFALGLTVVQHGANASVARPAAGVVYWQGSVDPVNKALGDFWLETAVYD